MLILQAGNALNYFGYGLVLPFEIIYLHQIRGFSTSTAGLVLAATMGTSAIVTPPTGALLDRYSAKALVVAGSLASALGYAGFAFVERPWQAFACSIVGGAGLGAAGTANRTLVVRLVTPEQRAAAFALNRVAGNFGIGAGATVAGFIVAAAQQLSSFQILYFFDAVTYAGFALIVLAAVPSPRAEIVTATDANGTGFRAVARDRVFLTVIAANIVLVVVGHTFFSNILPPFAKAHTPVGPAEIGIIILVNTSFIVIAQIPAVRVVARMRRTHAFAVTSALFAVGLLAVLPATLDPLGARCDQSPRRRCDRLRNRRNRTHSRSRAAGRGHGSSPSARPLPVSLQSDLHRFPWPSAQRLVAFSCRARPTPSGGVARLPRCWPEPSCFDSATAFPTRSTKHRHVLHRRRRPRESSVGSASHGGAKRSRPDRNSEKEDAVGSYQMVDVSQVEARNGIFRALTDQLGVAGFRINQLELAAGAEGPEHDHIGNDQEEVYAVVAGGGVLRTGGEEIPLRAGHFVHLPPDVRRQMVAGDQGLTWIGIGSATD